MEVIVGRQAVPRAVFLRENSIVSVVRFFRLFLFFLRSFVLLSIWICRGTAYSIDYHFLESSYHIFSLFVFGKEERCALLAAVISEACLLALRMASLVHWFIYVSLLTFSSWNLELLHLAGDDKFKDLHLFTTPSGSPRCET